MKHLFTAEKEKGQFGKTNFIVLLLGIVLLIQTIYYYQISHASKILVVGFLGILVLSAASLLYRKFRGIMTGLVARRIFPCVLLVMGVMNLVFFPAGSIPDEFHHFARSYAYATALVGGDSQTIREEDAPLFFGQMISNDMNNSDWTYAKEHMLDETQSGDRSLDGENVAHSATDPVDLIGELPQLKLPSAFGILIAKGLGLNHVALFYLGRLFNALYAMVLIVIAVRLAPVGKNIMIAVAMLPMTLHLVGSYSYDAGIIGLSFLVAAMVLRALKLSGDFSFKERTALIFVSALLAPCKVVYSVLCLAALLTPRDRFKDGKDELVFKSCLLIVPLLVVVLLELPSLLGLASAGDGADSRGGETGQMYSLAAIVSSPFASAALLMKTVECYGAFWLFNMVGDSLGWFQQTTSFPDYVPVLCLFLLAASLFRSSDDERTLAPFSRVAIALLSGVSFLGIVLSMWTGWTFTTDFAIQGVQGRYFIPLLPLLLMAFRPKGVNVTYSMAFPLIASFLTIDVIGCEYIASIVSLL